MSSEEEDTHAWKIIETYFQDNPQCLVRHHIDSYNDFFQNGIYQVFRDKNPVRIFSQYDTKLDDYICKCNLYMGGKDGTKVYIGKPVIHDDERSHYMFPNEARLRNMTYGMTVHYDVEVEIIRILREGEALEPVGIEEILGGKEHRQDEQEDDSDSSSDDEYIDPKEKQQKPRIKKGGAKKRAVKITPNEQALIRELTEKSVKQPIKSTDNKTQVITKIIPNVYLGKFPIMVQSDFCILGGLPPEVRFQMGECRNDPGGYFIIDGKEKVVIPQEKFADNMLSIRKSTDDHFLYSAEIRSVSENLAKPVRTLSVKIMNQSAKYSNRNIVVNIPNVRKPVPLFIVFRALGILSDKEIITMCLHDLDKYSDLLDVFAPSIREAGGIMSQFAALRFIAILTKHKTITYAHEILCDFFLPHIGETNYIQKAYYLGYMVFRLVNVSEGIENETNRDNYKYKRIDTTGVLISELFREYFKIQQNAVRLAFDYKLNYSKGIYEDNLDALIMQNYEEVFKENREVDVGFRKAFKGNWGAYTHTKRIGAVQDLNRLSYFSMMNHLRKTVLNLESGVKLVGPRVLHASQWGFFDPIDSPDGSNIGLHKHLSVCTYITKGMSREPVIKWLRENIRMRILEECPHSLLARLTKVIVNGLWAGVVDNPISSVDKIKLYRRNALLPIYLSVSFEISQNTIYIYCDEGRLSRPIFYYDKDLKRFSFQNAKFLDTLKDEKKSIGWKELISGLNDKIDDNFRVDNMKIYDLSELYAGTNNEKNPAKFDRFIKDKCVVEYVDASESETMLVAVNKTFIQANESATATATATATNNRYTHMEIHESFLFSMLCNMVNYLNNNPATRNNFSCGQTKQAVSMYNTNHQVRMDKAAVVLNSGQTPLVKSRYLEYVNREGNPYGENAIVAIMCYTGYNVEDAVLINEGALKRGLFHTTYYSTYETHEEKGKSENGEVTSEKIFANIENLLTNGTKVNGKRLGFEYDKLDKYGLVKEGTEIHDKIALIGMTSGFSVGTGGGTNERFDESVNSKKGQLGIVDKTFITEGEEGQRIAKVRVREIRIPALGDKMASRAGQKGTVGMIIPEADMPFTSEGLRPDIIINPHALPTRMTIGQLVECISAKAVAMKGGFADCTAFTNNSKENIGKFGELLTELGYHSSGNQIMYNGMTGEQIDSQIFIGPTFYMRLKHMVKDKVNYRTTGPRTALTRQTVGGRANDGGLRIGEMERDVVIAHGATNFLTESMMERGDKYYMAVCNKTGMISIYNSSRNLFMSPMADGPIKYTGSLNDSEKMRVVNITQFGRSFSIVCIPYSLKLLIQELQCMNITMRILTEENIGQIENLSFSRNIDKLTKRSVGNLSEVTDDIRRLLQKQKQDKQKVANAQVFESPEYNPKTPPLESPEYNPKTPPVESPEYNPNASLEYNPNASPEYNPNIPQIESPEYAPGSPAIENNANSPEYAKGSPAFAQGSPAFAQGSPALAKGGTGEYQINDIVQIRGSNSGIRWRIKDITSRFATLENLSPTNDQDTIKIVEPHQIYHAIHIDPRLQMPTEYDMQPNEPNDILPVGTPNIYPGGIQINPTFVVGDNNTLPTQTSSGIGERETSELREPSQTIENITPNKKIQFKEPEPEPEKSGGSASGDEKSEVSSNSFFDFLKIRKIM
jgi:DNA-directed RNA polymerase II subunit RPB2